MNFLTRLLLISSTSIGLSLSHPIHQAGQESFSPPFGDDDAATVHDIRSELFELAKQYAPVIYLSKGETYFPSSPTAALPSFKVFNSSSQPVASQPIPLSANNLDSLASDGADTHLHISGPHNGQPTLDVSKGSSEVLFGNPPAEDGAGPAVWAFIVDKEDDVVDIFYWTYYPYNLGKLVGPLGWVGNHVSDWEALSIRFVAGMPQSIDFLAHQGDLNAGTVLWKDVKRDGETGRPAVFAAEGSHGLWPDSGKHPYASALGLYILTDEIAEGGPRWDTQHSLEPIFFWSKPISSGSSPIRQLGSLSWVNYQGRWGNDGEKECWWHGILPICQTVDGPYGPGRWSMREGRRCAIGDVVQLPEVDGTNIKLRIHRELEMEQKWVGVSVVCRRYGTFEELPAVDADHGSQKPKPPPNVFDEEMWTWIKVEPLKSSSTRLFYGELEAPFEACRDEFKLLSYSVSMCSEDTPTTCTYNAGQRPICLVDPNNLETPGYSNGRAANLDDLDIWE